MDICTIEHPRESRKVTMPAITANVLVSGCIHRAKNKPVASQTYENASNMMTAKIFMPKLYEGSTQSMSPHVWKPKKTMAPRNSKLNTIIVITAAGLL